MPTDPTGDLAAAYLDAIGDDAETDRIGALMDAQDRADHAAIEARLDDPATLGRAARFYAAAGFPVFPLVPGAKNPATAHGLNDATTYHERVDRWWSARPDANIGLRTGTREEGGCGFDVIDLDGAPGVRSWYGPEGIENAPDAPIVLGRVRTTRPGGWHLYVAATGRGNRAGMAPGIDYRGRGGFVVAPPSRRVMDGVVRRWTWVDPLPALTAGGTS